MGHQDLPLPLGDGARLLHLRQRGTRKLGSGPLTARSGAAQGHSLCVLVLLGSERHLDAELWHQLLARKQRKCTMFNTDRLRAVLTAYKKDFDTVVWPQEG